MKEFLEDIFSNKYALENISRSCYGLGVGIIVRTETFDFITMGILVIISFLAFLVGLLVDLIRKDYNDCNSNIFNNYRLRVISVWASCFKPSKKNKAKTKISF